MSLIRKYTKIISFYQTTLSVFGCLRSSYGKNISSSSNTCLYFIRISRIVLAEELRIIRSDRPERMNPIYIYASERASELKQLRKNNINSIRANKTFSINLCPKYWL